MGPNMGEEPAVMPVSGASRMMVSLEQASRGFCDFLDLLAGSALSVEDFLQHAADVLPKLWPHADSLRIRIRYAGRDYGAIGYSETECGHEAAIKVHAESAGTLRVGHAVVDGLAWPDAEIERMTSVLADLLGKLLSLKRDPGHSRAEDSLLVQSDKMAALGTLISGVAHEINNPVNIATLSAQNLVEAWKTLGPALDQYRETFGDFRVGYMPYTTLRDLVPELTSNMLDSLQRVGNIVTELRDYVRQYPLRHVELTDMNLVVKSAVVLLTGVLKRFTQRFEVRYADRLPPVWGDYQRLEQVVINLVDNACRALPCPACGIEVSTSCDAESETVVITVRDEGAGIAPEDLHRITDPFFTTRRAEGASGLGLAVSLGIVTSHGGRLDFVSTPGRGTTARIAVPAAKPRETAETH